jgi:hypothetical protein
MESNSISNFEIKKGVKTVIEFQYSYRYYIETIGGTIIEGVATTNTPLEITASNDIKEMKIIVTENDIKPLRLV